MLWVLQNFFISFLTNFAFSDSFLIKSMRKIEEKIWRKFWFRQQKFRLQYRYRNLILVSVADTKPGFGRTLLLSPFQHYFDFMGHHFFLNFPSIFAPFPLKNNDIIYEWPLLNEKVWPALKRTFKTFKDFQTKINIFFLKCLILVWDWITIQKCLKNVEYFDGSGKGLHNGMK